MTERLFEFASLLGDDFSTRWMITMLHFLWQGAIVGAVAAMLAGMLRAYAAKTRYWIYSATMISLPICFAVTFFVIEVPESLQARAPHSAEPLQRSTLILPVSERPAYLETESPASDAALMPKITSHDAFEAPVVAAIEEPDVVTANANDIATANAAVAVQPDLEVPLFSRLAPWITSAYLACVGFFLLRLIVGLWGGHRLRSRATNITDQRLLRCIVRQAERVGLRCVPYVAYCEQVAVPTVVGILHPAVLLPASIMTGLSSDEITAIISHEFAHIRRHDLWMNLLQRAIESLLFFHPVVWFISRRLSAERELCCDDLVISSGHKPLDYAGALLRMAELCAIARQPNPATLAVNGNNFSLLERRIKRLMSESKTPHLQLTRVGVLAMLMVVALLIITPGIVRNWAQADEQTADESNDSPNKNIEETSEKDAAETETDLVETVDERLLTPLNDEQRNEIFRQIDSKLREGLLAIAERFPPLKQTNDGPLAPQLARRSKEGEVRIHVGYFPNREDIDDEAEKRAHSVHRYKFELVLQPKDPAKPRRNVFPSQDIVGEINIFATDKNIEAALDKLADECLVPLSQRQAASEERQIARFRHWKNGQMRPLKSSELIGVWQGSAKDLAVQIRCIARQSRIKGVKGTIEGELHLNVPRGLTAASVGFTDNANGWIDVTTATVTADSYKVTTTVVGRLERDTSGNLYLTTIENEIHDMFSSVERIELTRFANRTKLRSADIEELLKSSRALDANAPNKAADYKLAPVFEKALHLRDEDVAAFVLETLKTPYVPSTSISTSALGTYESPVRDVLMFVPQQKLVIESVFELIRNPESLSSHQLKMAIDYLALQAPDRILARLNLILKSKPNETVTSVLLAAIARINERESMIDPNGEIRGRLIDNRTGNPVEGMLVACGAIINDSLKGGGARTLTDADGRYRLVVPSPGIYSVWIKEFEEGSNMTAAADDGLLVEAGKVTESSLRLVPGRKVAGKVVEASGKPIAGVTVMSYSAARPQSLAGVLISKSADDGSFEFHLPPGRAYIYASHRLSKIDAPPKGMTLSDSTNIVISAHDEVPPITLTMTKKVALFGSADWVKNSTPGTLIVKRDEKAANVTGVVVDVDDKPIAEAKVFRYNGTIFETNEKGEFTVELERSSQTVMRAFHPGYRVWFGSPTSGDQLKIVMEKRPELKLGYFRGKEALEFIDEMKPAWSDEKLGIQFGLAHRGHQRQIRSGERVPLAVFFRNVSDKPLKIEVGPRFHWDVPIVLNSKGKAIEIERVDLRGTTALYKETLVPGEAFGFVHPGIGLGENPLGGKQGWNPHWKTPVAGTCKATQELSIRVASLEEGAHSKSDKFVSGTIEFEVLEKKLDAHEGDANSDQTPKLPLKVAHTLFADAPPRDAIIYMVDEGSGHRQAGARTTQLIVMPGGTAIVPANRIPYRNRESRIKLSMAELEELLRSLDEDCEFFDIAADGTYFFNEGESANDWDRSYKWIHVNDGKRNHTIGCGWGWESGTSDSIPSAVKFSATSSKLYALTALVSAGGRDEIAKLVEPANHGLNLAFPDLPPINADDFYSAECLREGTRIVTFRREKEGGRLSVIVERKTDGSSQPLLVYFNDERKDVETPPVIRGFDLAMYPVTKWSKSDVYERRPTRENESGTFYKKREGFEYQYSGVPSMGLWVHKDRKVFYVEHSDGVRRKVYGPIDGTPAERLKPLPVKTEIYPEESQAADNDSADAAESKKKAALEKAIESAVWSKENLGIQFGISHISEPTFKIGEAAAWNLLVRNNADKPVNVKFNGGFRDNLPKVFNADGHEILFFQKLSSFEQQPLEETLAAGEAFMIRHPVIFLDDPKKKETPQNWFMYWTDAKPGKYSLEFSAQIEVKSKEKDSPTKGDYFTAGPIAFDVAEQLKKSDDKTDERAESSTEDTAKENASEGEPKGIELLKERIANRPDRLHGIALRNRNPMGWKWRVYLPPGKEWQIKGAVGRIPAGRELPEARKTGAIDIAAAATGRILELEGQICSYDPESGWVVQVAADGDVFEGVDFAVWGMFPSDEQVEVADYVLGKRKWRSMTGGTSMGGALDVGSVTSKINDELHLTRWYYEPKDEPENTSGPFPGFVVWIEAKDAESDTEKQASSTIKKSGQDR